jgi:hypothetical protein
VIAQLFAEVPHPIDGRFDRQNRKRRERHGGECREVCTEHTGRQRKPDAVNLLGF